MRNFALVIKSYRTWSTLDIDYCSIGNGYMYEITIVYRYYYRSAFVKKYKYRCACVVGFCILAAPS